jgi:hypothetical protein
LNFLRKNNKKMINWKELEKFVAPGKVMTLVVMIDGKEIGAISFNVDSLAYKAALESMPAEAVKIAEKAIEKKEPVKEKEKIKPQKGSVSTFKGKQEEAPEPEPMDEGGDGIEADKETGEIIEATASISDKVDMNGNSNIDPGISEKRLTREQIMASAVPDSREPTNDEREAYERKGQPEVLAGEPEKKDITPQQSFGEEW